MRSPTRSEHFLRNDPRYFARAVPPRYHWRLYEWLRPRAVYLDIETNSFGEITVVGLYGQGLFTSLIRGESLTWLRLRDEFSRYDLLVTFCGSTFDLPMLRAHFPDSRSSSLILTSAAWVDNWAIAGASKPSSA